MELSEVIKLKKELEISISGMLNEFCFITQMPVENIGIKKEIGRKDDKKEFLVIVEINF